MTRAARDAALLEALRAQLGEPGLAWAAPPRELATGAESVVLDLALAGAGALSGVPLVARLLQTDDPGQLEREFVLQARLAALGFPAPRPVAHGPGRPGVLEPFLVMERARGRVLFSLLPAWIAAGAASAALGLGAGAVLLAVAWYGIGLRLQRRLHALPASAVASGAAEHGLDPAELGAAAWLDRLDAQAERLALPELRPALAWMRAHAPPAGDPVVCHGDYWPGNVMLAWTGVTGLIDWSNGTLAPKEFDLGWNRVQDAGDLPPCQRLPEPWRGRAGAVLQPFVWLALLPHRWLYRLVGRLDPAALDYFTALHCLRILVWSYERERASGGAPNPWSSPRARALVARRLARITGVAVAPPARPASAPGRD